MQIPHGFSLRRKLPRSSKVFLSIAAACAVSSFLLVRGDAARANGGIDRGPSVDVVVASHDIDPGATLSADDLRIVAMPAAYAPPMAIAALNEAVGLVAASAVPEGEALSSARTGRSVLAGAVGPGHLVVSATFASIPGGLTTADRVDAFATFGGARPYTELVGEDLRVLRIEPVASGFGGDAGTVVTLDVDATAARLLLQANATGTLALVALGAGTSATPSSSPSPGALPTPG
jgi:Flp pilus assembly protein CpaB